MAEEHVAEGMRKAIKREVTESAAALGLEIPDLGQTRSRRDYNRYDMALPDGDRLIVETAVITPWLETKHSVDSAETKLLKCLLPLG